MFSHCDTWPKARWHVMSSRPVVELAAATSVVRRHSEYRVAAWQPTQTNRLGMYRTAKYINSSTSVCQYTTNTADQLTGLPTDWPLAVPLTDWPFTSKYHKNPAPPGVGIQRSLKVSCALYTILSNFTHDQVLIVYLCIICAFDRDLTLTVHSGVLFQKQTAQKPSLFLK